MRLVILQQPDAVASYVATYVKKRILAFAPTPEKPFVLGCPTGSSPAGVYAKLVEFHRRGELSFANCGACGESACGALLWRGAVAEWR